MRSAKDKDGNRIIFLTENQATKFKTMLALSDQEIERAKKGNGVIAKVGAVTYVLQKEILSYPQPHIPQ